MFACVVFQIVSIVLAFGICSLPFDELTVSDIPLTYWGRVTHICVGNLAIIGSDHGLSPGRRQAIIWTNAVILLIRTLGTNFSEIFSEIRAFSFKKMHFKMLSAKWRPFCLGLNELIPCRMMPRVCAGTLIVSVRVVPPPLKSPLYHLELATWHAYLVSRLSKTTVRKHLRSPLLTRFNGDLFMHK